MKTLRALLRRLVGTFRMQQAEQEFAAELESHLEMHIEDNLCSGMAPGEARRQALIHLGGMEQTRQSYREQRSLPWVENLWHDIRFGLRMLRKSPVFTTVAVLTLALGIGTNTAIFSIVNGVLLHPLPFPHAEQLIILHESKPNFEFGGISFPNFKDWRRDNHSFSSMSVSHGYYFSLMGKGEAELVDGQYMTSGFFETLGIKPLLGRTFTEQEEIPGAAPIALISEGLWKRKFDASPNVLSKAISLNGRSYSIIGVIPSSFHLTIWGMANRDVYVPMGQWNAPGLLARDAGMGLRAIARVKPGVSIEQAKADMARVSQNLAKAFPDVDTGIGASLVPMKEQIVGDVRLFLLVIMAAVGLVLMIACVNIASLFLARSTTRTQEFGIRAALGASRTRMIRQLLTESLLLSIASGALGLVIAVWGTHTCLKLLPQTLPRAEEIGLDLRVLFFTLGITLLTGTLFGLLPAFRTSRTDPHSALKAGGRGSSAARHRTQNIFVISEMAIALVLLIGAGLMIRSLQQLWKVDPGFNPQNVLIFGYTLPPSMIGGNPIAIRSAFRNFDEQIAAIPGVTAVSQSWSALPIDNENDIQFWPDGQPKPASTNDMKGTLSYSVGPDYLKVMGMPLKRGRFFASHDDEKSPLVGVIDEVFAQKYFAGQDPIGKHIMLADGDKRVEIVGVVGHVKQWGLDADDTNPLRVQLYTSWMQTPDDFVRLAPSGIQAVLRYQGDLTQVFNVIRRTVAQNSHEQIFYDVHTMQSSLSSSLAQRRFVMIFLGSFAVLSLLLASIGVYGVIAYLIEQRFQEIGIRLALGAQRTHILGLILWQGMRLYLIGAYMQNAAIVVRMIMRYGNGMSGAIHLSISA